MKLGISKRRHRIRKINVAEREDDSIQLFEQKISRTKRRKAETQGKTTPLYAVLRAKPAITLTARGSATTIKEMERVIREEWDKLTPADWERCIKSMQKRYRLVIMAKGGSIKY